MLLFKFHDTKLMLIRIFFHEMIYMDYRFFTKIIINGNVD